MSDFRTFCPTCDIVRVPPTSIVIRPGDHHDLVDLTFVCPKCAQAVHQPLNWWAVPVLEEAGCTVADGVRSGPRHHPSRHHPSGQGPGYVEPITETEIRGFRAALEDPDWDELLLP